MRIKLKVRTTPLLTISATIIISPGFGFVQTTLSGPEQGQDFSADIGFLEGLHDQQIVVAVEVILWTAGTQVV